MKNGETSKVGKARGFENALEKLFDQVMEQLAERLTIPAVVISYAGPLQDLYGSDRFNFFERFLEIRNIKLLVSMMSTTAGIYVGPGAISLSFCDLTR